VIDIKDVERLNMGPDDVLIIYVPEDILSANIAENVGRVVRHALPGRRFLVVPHPYKLQVLTQAQADEMACICLSSPSQKCPQHGSFDDEE
jgi:hypothetical protein